MARALLTRSQKRILDLAIVGRNTAQIAAELGVDRTSVQGRLQRARDRMRARNNMELVARAMELGLIAPPRRATTSGGRD